MSIRGVFASHSAIVGERQIDLAARVLMNGIGGSAPLLALSSGMPTKKATDTAFSWIEDTWIAGNTTAAETVNSAATELDVVDANIWIPNSVVLNQVTGEMVLITAIADNTITIIRGISGTTAATITSGDALQSIGTAFTEGGGRPDPVTQKGESMTNYVQIFKNGWAITGTARAVAYATGDQMAYNRSQCFSYHAEDIERVFLWGKKEIRTLGNQNLRLTSGLIDQLETYGGLVDSAATAANAGDLSLIDLMEFFRLIFDKVVKGTMNERICFTSSKVVSLIQQMVLQDGTYQISQGESAYGINVTTLVGINGTIKLMTHPMMNYNTFWQKELYVLHPALINRRVLRDSWTEEYTKGRMNNSGVDADEGYIGIELGFELKGAACQGILRNITAAVESFPAA